MADPSYLETALHYCVDDLPGATIPAAALNKILVCLRDGKPLSTIQLGVLRKQGLEALHGLASGAQTYDSFREVALVEQAQRIERTAAAKEAEEAAERARKAELAERAEAARLNREAERRARESDPKYIARQKNMQLRAKYGLNRFIEEDSFSRLMKILHQVDSGNRLKEEDFVWLSTAGDEYFSDKLKSAYHRLEADYYAGEFGKRRDPWMAVNASSHYRKCDCAPEAISLIESVNVGRKAPPKLRSALCTTHGGALRDLKRRDEAARLGEQAHELTPKNYRPCTLLGALHMEEGNYILGQEWYDKALRRGAKLDSVDQDIRNIFFRADQVKRNEMRAFLLQEDPDRFSWASKNSG